jgi:hypothetical protein
MKMPPPLTVFPPALLSCALLAGCGGGGGDGTPGPTTYLYQGTLSGTNCFTNTPVSGQVAWQVVLGGTPAAGTGVALGESTTLWSGSMSSPTDFTVTTPVDSRLSIVASRVTPTTLHVVATTSCVSFRCCTTTSGDLAG